MKACSVIGSMVLVACMENKAWAQLSKHDGLQKVIKALVKLEKKSSRNRFSHSLSRTIIFRIICVAKSSISSFPDKHAFPLERMLNFPSADIKNQSFAYKNSRQREEAEEEGGRVLGSTMKMPEQNNFESMIRFASEKSFLRKLNPFSLVRVFHFFLLSVHLSFMVYRRKKVRIEFFSGARKRGKNADTIKLIWSVLIKFFKSWERRMQIESLFSVTSVVRLRHVEALQLRERTEN